MKLPFFFFFFFFFFLFSLPGSVAGATTQRLLAALPPENSSASVSFLSSPTGKYAAYFLRRATAAGGGSGDDLCYIQVAEISTGDIRWDSDCVPVSISNECSLVFSDSGLEILDGSRSAWSTDALFESPVQNLDLDDEGDIRITGEDGDLAWKASDEAQKNQLCGSPELAAAAPAPAKSIGKGSEMGRAGPTAEGVNGPGIGYGGLPLVDSTPYDSGSLKGVVGWVGMGRVLFLCLGAMGGVHF